MLSLMALLRRSTECEGKKVAPRSGSHREGLELPAALEDSETEPMDDSTTSARNGRTDLPALTYRDFPLGPKGLLRWASGTHIRVLAVCLDQHPTRQSGVSNRYGAGLCSRSLDS